MIITKLHIDGFGKFHNYEFTASEGVNVITGLNEAGKTTLHLFIRSMLYGVSTRRRAGKKSIAERMLPWQQPEIYGGSMEVEADGAAYRIVRDFTVSEKDLHIFALSRPTEHGARAVLQEIADPETKLKELLKDLSETAYVNTVSAGQLSSATEKDMAGELRRYAANLTTTVNPNMNADRALAYLEQQKKELESALNPNAIKEYNTVLGRIRELEQELSDPGRNNRIPQLLEANESVRRSSEEATGKIAENELLISTLTGEMKRRGFEENTDIDRIEAKARMLYRDFTERSKTIPALQAIGGITLFLGLFGGFSCFRDVFGLIAFFPGKRTLILVISIFLTIIGLVLLIRVDKLSREKNKAEKLLKAMLEKHLVDDGGPAVKFGEEFSKLEETKTAPAKDNAITEEKMQFLYACFEETRLTKGLLDTAHSQRDGMVSELRSLNEEQSRNLTELERQHVIRSGVESDMTQLYTMKNRAAALEREIAENAKLRDDIESVELAMDTLTQLSETIQDAAGTYVNKEAAGMLQGLTGGIYNSINAGSGYEIELNSDNGMISVQDLSQGTADQVHMALRLSAIRFIVGKEDAIPLILDDSFALYDDERLLKAVRFLSEQYHGQILIFTCQQREEELLTKAEIPHHSIRI